MATYLISFRIADGSDYHKRWSSVAEAIRKKAMDGTSWEETTSLVVLKSDETPERLAGFIAANSDFSSKKDTLLVVNTSKNTFSTKGVIEDREMPKSLFGHSSFLDQLLR